MQQLRGVQIRKYIPPHAARPLDPHVHPTIHPSAYLCPRPHTCHQYLCLRCSHAPSHDHDPTAAKHTHITHPYRQLHRPCYSIKLLPHLHCISDAPSHVVFVCATGGSPGMGGAPFIHPLLCPEPSPAVLSRAALCQCAPHRNVAHESCRLRPVSHLPATRILDRCEPYCHASPSRPAPSRPASCIPGRRPSHRAPRAVARHALLQSPLLTYHLL